MPNSTTTDTTGGLSGTPTTAEESSLSSWAGPYVTEMLGRGQALASMPYTAYTGPLTAGASPLQQQAFSGLASLVMPSTLTGAGMGGQAYAFPSVPSYGAPMGAAGTITARTPTPGTFVNTGFPAATPMGAAGTITARTPTPGTFVNTGFPAATPMGTARPGESLNALSMSRPFSETVPSGMSRREDFLSQIRSSLSPEIAAQMAANLPTGWGDNLGPNDAPLYTPMVEGDNSAPGPATPIATPAAQQGIAGMLSQQQAPTTQQQIASLMNPYIEQALNPQLEAAKRQAQIQAQSLQSQYGKAGAYGGSRQGIAEAELQRGLLDRMAQLTGQGYSTAYDKAVDLLGAERGYGLNLAQAQQQAGAQQRAIEQEGITADIAQFEQERDYPYKQVQFMQSLLQGLPLQTQSYSYYEPSGLQSLAGSLGSIKTIADLLKEIL